MGGGIRNIEDIQKALNSGADKVFINSAAVKNPNFIKEAVSVFGSSTIVVSIETRKNRKNFWEIFISLMWKISITNPNYRASII